MTAICRQAKFVCSGIVESSWHESQNKTKSNPNRQLSIQITATPRTQKCTSVPPTMVNNILHGNKLVIFWTDKVFVLP